MSTVGAILSTVGDTQHHGGTMGIVREVQYSGGISSFVI